MYPCFHEPTGGRDRSPVAGRCMTKSYRRVNLQTGLLKGQFKIRAQSVRACFNESYSCFAGVLAKILLGVSMVGTWRTG